MDRCETLADGQQEKSHQCKARWKLNRYATAWQGSTAQRSNRFARLLLDDVAVFRDIVGEGVITDSDTLHKANKLSSLLSAAALSFQSEPLAPVAGCTFAPAVQQLLLVAP